MNCLEDTKEMFLAQARAGSTDQEPKVSVAYDLLDLTWKTHHLSGKFKQELYGLREELGVICTPSSVKGT